MKNPFEEAITLLRDNDDFDGIRGIAAKIPDDDIDKKLKEILGDKFIDTQFNDPSTFGEYVPFRVNEYDILVELFNKTNFYDSYILSFETPYGSQDQLRANDLLKKKLDGLVTKYQLGSYGVSLIIQNPSDKRPMRASLTKQIAKPSEILKNKNLELVLQLFDSSVRFADTVDILLRRGIGKLELNKLNFLYRDICGSVDVKVEDIIGNVAIEETRD